MVTKDAGVKHIVYTPFTSSGRCLPPVIFTGAEPPPPDDDPWYYASDGRSYAYVHYIPGLTQASTHTTEIYLETIFGRWENEPEEDAVWIVDSAPWHKSREAVELWGDHGLDVRFLPATTGKWLNPNDQAIHREMRRTFNRLQRADSSIKTRNIIDSYYAVAEDVVKNSYRHTHILLNDYEEHLRNEAARGFRAGSSREVEYEEARQLYEKWFKMTVRRPSDLLRPNRPASLGTSGLDGVRWTRYGK